VNRDWTWDGLADRSFDVLRDGTVVGSIEVRQTVSGGATTPSLELNQHRGSTTLIFFDAIDPGPAPSSFPVAPSPSWTIQPYLRSGITTPDEPMTLAIRLPKAARPAQTPKLASAGVALSPYQPVENYARTLPRQRALWLEFAEPILDPDDQYFARVLAYGPDPLLLRAAAGGEPIEVPPDPPIPPLPIDPEPVRMVLPGEKFDLAGLDAMQPLTKATDSDRHFLLPLPPGLSAESLEMFGFWTYELVVGHAGEGDDKWSTAQARFGRPLRVTGVQHPAPGLRCSGSRTPGGLKVSAPLAMPVLNGQRLLSPRNLPKTQMWFLLYAQAMQADRATFRNILLLRKAQDANIQFTTRDVLASAIFPEIEGQETIRSALAGLGLPLDSPLSIMAIELLPPIRTGRRQRDRLQRSAAGHERAELPDAEIDDPLGNDLGQQRILRVSPLTPVQAICPLTPTPARPHRAARRRTPYKPAGGRAASGRRRKVTQTRKRKRKR
jgi:hypothetical protein